jgi:hypothetical protein
MTPVKEDLTSQGQLRFRVEGKIVHVFKRKGESVEQVRLKVLGYTLYAAEEEDLRLDPAIHFKFKPDVAGFDLLGDVRLWISSGELSSEQLAYILKHSDAGEVVLLREDVDLEVWATAIRRQIHYRYTNGKLVLFALRDVDNWFDANDVKISMAHIERYAF